MLTTLIIKNKKVFISIVSLLVIVPYIVYTEFILKPKIIKLEQYIYNINLQNRLDTEIHNNISDKATARIEQESIILERDVNKTLEINGTKYCIDCTIII